jgi:cupin 2 domain-containing protein
MTNLFSTDKATLSEEVFETLLKLPNIHIEKITSNGQTSSQWYESEKEEWVVLIEGEGKLLFDNGEELTLKKGEHLYIAKMKKHKVTYTSSPTIWLAIHFS